MLIPRDQQEQKSNEGQEMPENPWKNLTDRSKARLEQLFGASRGLILSQLLADLENDEKAAEAFDSLDRALVSGDGVKADEDELIKRQQQ